MDAATAPPEMSVQNDAERGEPSRPDGEVPDTEPVMPAPDAEADAETGDAAAPQAGVEAGPSDAEVVVAEAGPPQTWASMPGMARDIAVGTGGDVWIVGPDPERYGFSVHKWVEDRWVRVASDGAERIAVDPAGAPWILSSTGSTLRRSSNVIGDATWMPIPGCAIDIGIGANGDVWSVQCDHRVFKWDGAAWQDGGLTAVAAARIAVGPDGAPWIIDLGERVFRRTSPLINMGRWEYLHGTGARDIAVAPDGRASIVSDVAGSGGFLVKLLNGHGAWVALHSSATAHNLAAGARDIWITDPWLKIFRHPR